MKLVADISGEKHDVDVRREGNTVFAEIDGRRYEVEASEPEPNVFLLKSGNKIFEAFVSRANNTADPVMVHIGGREVEIAVSDPKRLRGSGGGTDHAGGAAEIKTAMPGKVVRILVATGDTVQKGDGVIVVEAMKMQNEMKSPKDGVVKDLKVTEGDTVGAGDVLVVIE